MKTVLITGINGFLGSNLAKRLSVAYKIIGTEYTLNSLHRIGGLGFKIYEADEASIKRVFIENGIDIIIHTATFYGRNNEDFEKLFNSNLLSAFSLLELSVKNKCDLFINTDTALERYTSAYALTKRQFYDWLFFRSSEIKVANMQLEHFYGGGASPTNFISLMIRKLLNNEQKIDLTLGEQRRDFVYYEDVIDAFELVIQRSQNLEQRFNSFEIASGEIISIHDLMLLLKELTRSKAYLNFGAIPYRENELMISSYNLEPIFKFGWKAKTVLKDGLVKTINEIK